MSNNFFMALAGLLILAGALAGAGEFASARVAEAEVNGRKATWTTHAWHGEVDRWRRAGRPGPRPRWGARY